MRACADRSGQDIVQQCSEREHDDLMSGAHEDVERENECLRKEVCLLRDGRLILLRKFSLGKC
jgi:hypothetical protein